MLGNSRIRYSEGGIFADCPGTLRTKLYIPPIKLLSSISTNNVENPIFHPRSP